jgi:hypothetical protein
MAAGPHRAVQAEVEDQRAKSSNRGRFVAVVIAGLLGASLGLPVSAVADSLPGSTARYNAYQVAADNFLTTRDATDHWVDTCRRRSAHKISCDANISGESDVGSFNCPTYSYSCYQRVRTFLCWRTVTSFLSPHWQRYRVTRRVSVSRCTYGSRTDVY